MKRQNITSLGCLRRLPHQISREYDQATQPRLEAESLRGKYDSQSESSARSSSLGSNVRVGCSHDHFDCVARTGKVSTICW